MSVKLRGFVLAALTLVAAGACTSYHSYRRAQMAASAEEWDQAVLFYMEAVESDPGNIDYQAALLRAKIHASQQHFEKARRFYQSGVLERALVEYQQAVQLDPSNQSALVELQKVQEELAEARNGRAGATLEEMKRRVSERSQPPQLNPRSNEPIDLSFPEPVPIKDIYRALGRAFGINVMFDSQLKDQEIAVELKQVTAQEALEFLMRTSNDFYKVLDEHSIIIIEDTPQNRRNYEDLVIKTFFLSNAEVKDVVTMLRSLIDAKKIATNEQLNAIILRDTADKVKVAERIITANDKARAEVVVDVELLQINTSKLKDIGVTWPGQITASLNTGGDDGVVRVSDLEFLNQNNWTLTIPSFVYDFVKTSTDAQLLARPQLRISEGEKASLVIGDRVPVPVTSFNTGNTVGGNIVPITSFQYQDVGITISIEPRVHHNKEVTLQLRVEVSNLSGTVQAGQNTQPIIGTRTIESTIRLKDGETNFLAGLIRTDESVSDSGVPGLSEIPVVGRLFSKNRNQHQRTDVILTLTPHIIRAADITEEDLLPIWVGTESNITFRGGSPRVESDVEGPFDGADETSAEQIRELIQRRIQRLPRGLRDQAGEGVQGQGQEGEQGPPGVDLVPAQPPGSVFQQPEEQEEPPTTGRNDADFAAPPGGGATAPAETESLFAGRSASPAALLSSPLPVAFATLATEAGEAEAPVRLAWAPRQVRVAAGETFEVTLAVEAATPVAHLPLRLAFDPEVLTVLEVRRGGFLGDGEEAQVLAGGSRPGEVVLGASRLGAAAGVVGEGTLLTLRLRAGKPGSTPVRFTRAQALGAGLEEILPLAAEPLMVEVGPPTLPGRPVDGLPGERPARP